MAPMPVAAWVVTVGGCKTISVSLSVAELLPGVGSTMAPGIATVAVLESVPMATALIVALATKVTVPAGSRLTIRLMLPVPPAPPQLEPIDALHVQVAKVIAAGNVSVTVAAVTALGPLFVTVIVYVTVEP